MIFQDNIIKEYLRNVYFISGTPCGGKTTITRALGEKYKVINLTGCTQEAICYMIARGYPVLAKTSASGNVLIVGYDAENVWVYDPTREKQVRAIASDDSRELFLNNGNCFMSYIEL